MKTDKLLQTIYKGTTMAVDSINNLMEYVDNEEMIALLQNQQDKYYKIKADVKRELEGIGINELEDLRMARMTAKYVMKMRMAFDRTKEKVAKMLYRGAEMGLEDLASEENNLKRAGEKVPELAKEYREMLVYNRKELQKFM